MMRSFTPSQVLSHNKEDDLYLVIRNKVYDASEFAKEHLGGEELLLDLAGQDATEAYVDAGHSEEADEILSDILVGHLEPVVISLADKPRPEESLKSTNIVVKIQETIASTIRPVTENSRAFLVPDKFQETELIEKTVISHNVAIYRFKLPAPDSILGLPTGQHVSIGAFLPQADGISKEVIRSYTPISNDQEPGSFQLLIKSYPSGNISKHVGCLNVGDRIRVRGPKGAFNYTPNMVRHFGMVAGGTGITPMLQIVEAILRGRPDGDETEIDLIYANVSAADILLKQRLDALAKVVSGFRVYYVLDKPPEGWTGGVGYVTVEMISKWLPKPAKDVKILLCGPPPMISGLKKSTEALGFDKASPVSKLDDQVFAF